MRQILLFLLICVSIITFSQQSYVVKGIVIDNNGNRMNTAHLRFENKDFLVNEKGEFYVRVPEKAKKQIKITHIGYETIAITTKKNWYKRTKNDTLIRYFKLREKINELDAVVVSAIKKPKQIFGSDSIGVEDFELLADKIVLLGSTKSLKRQSTIYLTNKKQEILDQIFLPDVAEKLVRDFRKEIHVVCKEKVYHIAVEEENLRLENVDKDYFYTYLAPVVDTIKTELYFSNYNEFYPEFKYKKYDRKDSMLSVIKSVEDKLMMELYRSEYKYVDVRTKLWAMEMEQESGIDKEIWVGATHFTHSIYYDELYAPLFKKEDSLFIFDHYSNYIFKYHSDSGLVDSTVIAYHLKPVRDGWKKNIIQDVTKENLYAHFDKAGYAYLKEINTNNGALVSSQKLFYRYVEKIRIKDGYIYYIYRPFESTQEKFIYREELIR